MLQKGKIIGGYTVVSDLDDAYGDITVIENADMAVTQSYNIATRYTRADGLIRWIRKEIGLNAMGDTLYIRTYEEQEDPPVFVQLASGIPL